MSHLHRRGVRVGCCCCFLLRAGGRARAGRWRISDDSDRLAVDSQQCADELVDDRHHPHPHASLSICTRADRFGRFDCRTADEGTYKPAATTRADRGVGHAFGGR